MSREKFRMDSSQIAQIMGTVGSPLIVISELLKNAVDASAENISDKRFAATGVLYLLGAIMAVSMF